MTNLTVKLRGLSWLALLVTVAGAAAPRQQSSTERYGLVDVAHGVALLKPGGDEVFTYLTTKPEGTTLSANSTCCFHPLRTPSGVRVTDLGPKDHPHHRGAFLAWHAMEFRSGADFSALGGTRPVDGYNVSRADFWGWGEYAPTEGRVIRNRDVRLLRADPESAEILIENSWTVDSQEIMAEVARATVRTSTGAYVIDLVYELTPASDLVLEQSAFGGFCVRARRDGAFRYSNPGGVVALPDPHFSMPKLNWPAAEWYDYAIELEPGKTVGVAVIDHPANPAATWHNPRYVGMINPCIVAAGTLAIPRGERFDLRYRLVVHDGPTPANMLDQLAEEFRYR